MKCDRCEQPAVVHEVTVRDGVKNETHLCESCAKAAGVALPDHKPLDQLLTQFVVKTPAGDERRARARRSCPECGLSMAAFRQSGILGCPMCYTAFTEALEGVIERAHNGGTSHVGKAPRRRGSSIDHQRRIQKLVKDLQDAVSTEQFERAAELRDRLQALQAEFTTADATEDDERHADQ